MLECPKLPEAQLKGIMSLLVLSKSHVVVKKTLLKLILESGFFTRPVRCTIDAVDETGERVDLRDNLAGTKIAIILQTAGVNFKVFFAHGYYDATGKFVVKTLPGDRLTCTFWLSQLTQDSRAHDVSRAEIADLEIIDWVNLALVN